MRFALCEYPEIFGGAMCLSTHWPGTFDLNNTIVPNAMLSYLRKKLPVGTNHKLYFDHGTIGLDAAYTASQRKVDALLLTKNFGITNFKSLSFEGADHTERDWARRLHVPLYFLLSK